MLNSIDECKEFLATASDQEIADQLRRDQQKCKEGGLPSVVAVLLPSFSWRERGVSVSLLEKGGNNGVSKALYRLNYRGVLTGIKSHIEKLGDGSDDKPVQDREGERPSTIEFQATGKVLRYMELQSSINPESSLREIQDSLRNHASEAHYQNFNGRSVENCVLATSRKCYICHAVLLHFNIHSLYPSLCLPCGSFNLSSSKLSLSANLQLSERTALVTGARVNLGFHVALRLLRCGARVISTSRYPRDAESRYRLEPDFGEWEHQLKVVGADFRTAKDVFALVALVKKQSQAWSKNSGLDILVNNAAQTLTDSVEMEKKAVEKDLLLEGSGVGSLVLEYSPRYKPGVRGVRENCSETSIETLILPQLLSGMNDAHNDRATLSGVTKVDQSLVASKYESRPPSSWTQTLSAIPYEDLISAHSVNTFVPLILIRELLPSMGRTKTSEVFEPMDASKIPQGFIINVTSREGLFGSLRATQNASIFEATEHLKRPSPQKLPARKSAHHTHTYMTKAALNMITESEAEACWQDRRVAMNSVDPGYMSAAPGFGETNGVLDLPLTWEDGAGRVLWPIAVGWGKEDVLSQNGNGKGNSRVVWGKFLKHYRATTWGGEGML